MLRTAEYSAKCGKSLQYIEVMITAVMEIKQGVCVVCTPPPHRLLHFWPFQPLIHTSLAELHSLGTSDILTKSSVSLLSICQVRFRKVNFEFTPIVELQWLNMPWTNLRLQVALVSVLTEPMWLWTSGIKWLLETPSIVRVDESKAEPWRNFGEEQGFGFLFLSPFLCQAMPQPRSPHFNWTFSIRMRKGRLSLVYAHVENQGQGTRLGPLPRDKDGVIFWCPAARDGMHNRIGLSFQGVRRPSNPGKGRTELKASLNVPGPLHWDVIKARILADYVLFWIF